MATAAVLAPASPSPIDEWIETLRRRLIAALVVGGLTAAATALTRILEGGALLRTAISLGLHLLLEPWLLRHVLAAFS